MTEDIKGICEILHDIMDIFTLLNYKRNNLLDLIIREVNDKIDLIENKY